MVDDSFIFSVMYSNLSFLAQPSNNARLLKDDLLNDEPNQFTPCQAKYDDDNNDDVNEFNNDGVEVQYNNSKDTNTNAEASEERSMVVVFQVQGDQIRASSCE